MQTLRQRPLPYPSGQVVLQEDWQLSWGTNPQVGRKRWGPSNPRGRSQVRFANEYRCSHYNYGSSKTFLPLCVLLDHFFFFLMFTVENLSRIQKSKEYSNELSCTHHPSTIAWDQPFFLSASGSQSVVPRPTVSTPPEFVRKANSCATPKTG